MAKAAPLASFPLIAGTSATFTVPSDATFWTISLSWWAGTSRALVAPTVSSFGAMTSGSLVNNAGTTGGPFNQFVAHCYGTVSSTGAGKSVTIAFTPSGSIDEGPSGTIDFYKDQHATTPVKDVQIARSTEANAAATATVNTDADSICRAVDMGYRQNAFPTQTGWTQDVVQDNNNSNRAASYSRTSPGTPTQSFTGMAQYYRSLVLWSIQGVSDGGGGVNVDLSTTDVADTLASTAGVVVGVALSRADAADTLSATATLPISVSLSATDAADTLASTAALPISVGLAVTDVGDILASSAGVVVVATLAVTDEADTLEATAVVGDAPVTVTLDVTDTADTLSAEADVTVSAALAVTDAADTLSATSTMPVTVNASATDAADTLASTVGAVVGVALGVTDAADTLTATAIVQQEGVISVTLDVVDAADTLAATVTLGPVPQPQPSGSGGRNWLIDVPVDARVVRLWVRDDDDTLHATATVKWSAAQIRKLMAKHAKQLAKRGRKVQAEIVDADDTLLSAATVRWPPVQLARKSPLTRAAMR